MTVVPNLAWGSPERETVLKGKKVVWVLLDDCGASRFVNGCDPVAAPKSFAFGLGAVVL